MATIPFQLFFKGNREYKVGTITFDLLTQEQHNFNNQVSDHNIEDGSTVSDHIKNELENGSLTGLITNFSIRTYGITTNRAQDAFEEMIRLWKSKELVTVITIMRVYEQMAITSVSVARSNQTGEAIELNISFKKLRTVKLQKVQIETGIKINEMTNDLNRQSSPTLNTGSQVGVTK